MRIISTVFLLIFCFVFLIVCDENGNNGDEEKSDTWEKALKGYSPAYGGETSDGGFIIAACCDSYSKEINLDENPTSSSFRLCRNWFLEIEDCSYFGF